MAEQKRRRTTGEDLRRRRELVFARYLEGATYRGIASEFGTDAMTVWHDVHRELERRGLRLVNRRDVLVVPSGALADELQLAG